MYEIDLSEIPDIVPVTKANILKATTEFEIFCTFFKEFIPGKLYSSPFRRDSDPSFNIFKGNDIWRYKDFGDDSGNCFDFVMKLEECDFRTALKTINETMNLGLGTSSPTFNRRSHYKEPEIVEREKSRFSWKVTKWTENDYKYWDGQGIDREILNECNVHPVAYLSGYSKNGPYSLIASPEEPIYAYTEDEIRFYRPLSKIMKFLGTKGMNDVFGLAQSINNSLLYYEEMERQKIAGVMSIGVSKPTCFITGGEKDVMAIMSGGHSAITFNSESAIPLEWVIKRVLPRYFDNIYFLYDNDDTGRKFAEKWSKEYDLPFCQLQNEGYDITLALKNSENTHIKHFFLNLLIFNADVKLNKLKGINPNNEFKDCGPLAKAILHIPGYD